MNFSWLMSRRSNLAQRPNQENARGLQIREATSKAIGRTSYILVGTCLFCIITLGGSPDAQLLSKDSSVELPILGYDIAFGLFLVVGPTVIIGLWCYVQVFIAYSRRLGMTNGDGDVDIFSMNLRSSNVIAWLLVYAIAPATLVFFLWKAWPQPEYRSPLVLLTIGIIVWSIFLQLRRCPLHLRKFVNPFLILAVFLVPAYVLSSLSGRQLNLHRAGLANKDLRGLELIEVYAVNGNFSGSDLKNADLRDAQLDGADFANSRLESALLIGASLREANLKGARLENTAMQEADLSNADLPGAELGGANLTGAILRGADLTGAALVDAVLTRANLQEAKLEGANLSRVDLRYAYLNGASLDRAQLLRARLGGTSLEGVHAEEANFRGADLRASDFEGAELSKSTFATADLSHADVQRATLDETNLERANFEGANLRGAKFQGARLTKTILTAADIAEADFTDADGLSCEQLGSALNFAQALTSLDCRIGQP